MPGLKNLNQPARKLGGAAGVSETLGPVIRSVTEIDSTDSPYTVQSGDYYIQCDCTGGAVTVNLPTAVGNTRELVVQKVDASVNAITIEGFDTETINGALNNSDLDVQYEAFKLNANLANYFITGSF